jgi:hypothetical protein
VGGASGDPRSKLTISFRDLQILQRFQESVQLVQAALESNQEVISSLKTLNSNLWEFSSNKSPAAKIAWHYIDSALEQRLSEFSRHKRNIESLFARIRGRTGLVRKQCVYYHN